MSFWDDTEFSIQALKNLILSYLGILKGNRKDLYPIVVLTWQGWHRTYLIGSSKKYIPFLDSYLLEVGVDFQECLRHELIDSDIISLHDTHGFNSSPIAWRISILPML